MNTYEGLSDEQLMRKYTGGDTGALGEVYDRYNERLIHYFYRMLWQDNEKAADFMQEVFLKLARQPEAYDPSRPFKTWLFSVAHNMCKNEYKKQEIRRKAHEEIQVDGVGYSKSVGGNEFDSERFVAALDFEVGQMAEPHKSTFILRFRQELQVKEIAQIMDVSEGTVKSRIFYTLKKLGEKLKAFDPKLQYDGSR